ncbi:hypothetical protein [Novosphingobium album (ex Hu et al. 2023)]|uniref:Uncharacterized protein n=1 Tax=Novosphingobium album (ex Hu et al. 2023) TaxID=2930093 RepID=A0ABT0B0M2_9SPHN|nr:hypothetical protein [Novosphingobium album (ex Hu et al. 2023)]MCJ2178594.1 hypothetical protein [Novosphingobium album (ex Hu et al. 2023)]
MKVAGFLIIGILALAVAAAALKIAILGILALVLLALVANPRQTLGFIVGLLYLGALGRYPVPTLILSAALVAFAAIEKHRSKP